MNIVRETNTKKFILSFLLIFLLAFFLTLAVTSYQNHAAWQLLLNHERAIATSLLEQEVPDEFIVKALNATKSGSEGINLLNQLGIHERTNLSLLSSLSAYGQTTFLFSLLTLLLSFFLLVLVIIRFLLNQERLYQKAIEIVASYTAGSFDTPLPESQEGSIYHLFGEINHMTGALKAGQEAEHEAKEFLKNTISDISHQLKTPLAALSMYNEIILQEPDCPKIIQTFARKSDASIERMKSLILSLLKIARLDIGSITFQKTLCPVSELLDAALEPLTFRANQEEKEIFFGEAWEGEIYCDPVWTTEAIGNILKNALDHTSSGGKIEIHKEQTPLETRIQIADNGSGISPEDLHHIFKRFYRSKTSGQTSGAGLGLPLAKAIVEGQGGSISVQSNPGAGAIFTVSFPRSSKYTSA